MLSKNEATPLVTLNLLYFVISLSVCIESCKVGAYDINNFENLTYDKFGYYTKSLE